MKYNTISEIFFRIETLLLINFLLKSNNSHKLLCILFQNKKDWIHSTNLIATRKLSQELKLSMLLSINSIQVLNSSLKTTTKFPSDKN